MLSLSLATRKIELKKKNPIERIFEISTVKRSLKSSNELTNEMNYLYSREISKGGNYILASKFSHWREEM